MSCKPTDPNHVLIFDTTLRDGEQVPGAALNTLQKLEVAKQLERLGVDIIEAGFPISSPGDFQAVELIARECRSATICALARAIPNDIKTAAEAIKDAAHPRLHTFISSSDIHIEHQFKSTREKVLKQGVEAVELAKSLCDDVEFSAMDAGRTENAFLATFVEAAIAAGATTINLPDTTGYCYPDEFGEKIHYLYEHVKGIDQVVVSVHCHNDLGLATANALAGVLNGARQVEVAMNGLGERAGNTALEEVVMALKTREQATQLFTTINTKEIHKTSRMVSQMTGMPIQPNKAIVGKNAFAHSSGIHQDGVIKNRSTYEVINPEDVGVKTELVLTARSGRKALKHRLELLGYTEVSAQDLEAHYQRFLNLADAKKEVYDDDLIILMQEDGAQSKTGFQLQSVNVVCGSDITPSADLILLDHDGKQYKSHALGTGPVDAAFQAVDNVVEKPVRLLEFLLKAVTAGIDAQADVQVLIEADDKTYVGNGVHTNIVIAATKAYLGALNKAPSPTG